MRTALKADLVPCAELFARTQQEIEPRHPPWRADEFPALIDGEELLVAVAGPEVAGFLALWRTDAFVHFLHVAPTWRRRGVGRRLMATAGAEVDRPLELKCLVGNARALAFYEGIGCRVVDRGLDPKAPYVRLRRAG